MEFPWIFDIFIIKLEHFHTFLVCNGVNLKEDYDPVTNVSVVILNWENCQ